MLISVQEAGVGAPIERRGWPVSCGVPLTDGQVKADAIARGKYLLLDAGGRAVPCQAEVATTWGTYPAGSNGYVKWLHLHFLADVPAGKTAQYRLQIAPNVRNDTRTALTVDDSAGAVTITTGLGKGALRLRISKQSFNVLDEVWLDSAGDGFGPDDRIVVPRSVPNLTVGYDHCLAAVNTALPQVEVERAGPVLALVRIRTKLDDRFESVVRIFAWAGSSYVRIQETLVHGPTGQGRSAVQSQPVVMKSHVLELPLALDAGGATVSIGTGEALPEPAQLSARAIKLSPGRCVVLEQDLHHPCIKGNVGADGLSQAFGYQLSSGNEQLASGKRAPGWIDLSDGRHGVTAAVRYFWQTFPKRLVAQCPPGAVKDAAPCILRLEHWAEGAQLEPLGRNYNWMGMAKTHDVGLFFHASGASAAEAQQAALAHLNELFAVCEPQQYCSSLAYGHQPLSPALRDGKRLHEGFDQLVSQGLNRERIADPSRLQRGSAAPAAQDGFYSFREREDDYGYFNFGDFLVGDYWGCQEYDPAYCMLQQFYRSGEPKYLEFSVQCARMLYDVLYSHTYTQQTSNYPQRSHDKSGSHFAGEDSHGQREMNTDPGHVFLAGLANYWYLTADPRARDVILWSLPCYAGDDWYRNTGGGTWRHLGGYLLTVFAYAYELTWDNRYVEAMLWIARQYVIENRTRHLDGIWWNWEEKMDPKGGGSRLGVQWFCQPWLADSFTNGYWQLLEVYPGCPYRQQIESAIVNLADFMLVHGFRDSFDGLQAGLYKDAPDSTQYHAPPNVYRSGMPNMAILTLGRAYYLTGDGRYLEGVRKALAKSYEHTGTLSQLKPVTQATNYPPMVLPYLDGSVKPRRRADLPVVAPANNWLEGCRKLLGGRPADQATLLVGDELAAACAPPGRRGRAWGNQPGWRLADVLGNIDAVLAAHHPTAVVVLVGGSDLPSGHPERVDWEANYTLLLRRIARAGATPVCVTLPPCSHLESFAWNYNAVIAQAASLNRLPLIDLNRLMNESDPPTAYAAPPQTKVPPAEAIQANRFTPGHEQVVCQELANISRLLAGDSPASGGRGGSTRC